MDWLLYEKEAQEKGYRHICGVDEAGRGPLAGPVCAAAVILPEGCIIEGVNDSKKLTEKKREALFDVIIETAVSCSIAFGTVEEIERDNILATTMHTMRRAVEGLSVKADFAMIDGNRLPELAIPARTIVGGDAKSMSIAAASILAKVSRDRLMLEYAEKYPQYGFEKHKGYGTKLHVEAILAHGACPIHRQSFLKKIYARHGMPKE
ncbi:ribonuclease HII [Ruminococcus sp.]|uniref:ribonuclease HII n=1 Tax=Ruminococcus sp. TaxID=41978 RepID=UPI00388D5E0A